MGKQNESSGAELERFPQFAPDKSFSPDHFDFETTEYCVFPKDREYQVRTVLAKCIRPHLQSVPFLEKPTSLGRFLHAAMSALGLYIHQYESLTSFDRERARQTLSIALDAVRIAQQTLQPIAAWPELATFLQTIFVQAGKNNQTADKGKRKISTKKVLLRELRLHDVALEAYRKCSPLAVATVLLRLEPLLTLALESVKFQPGDYQRKEYIQDFVDEIAFSWICGTGELPTFSKTSNRSRRPSSFAALMIAINTQVLPEHMRSRNHFRDYAQKSVKRMKREFARLLSS